MENQNYGTFRHQPLRSQKNIRLLRLIEGCDLDVTLFDFEEHSIESLPSYTALSYAWGNSPSTVEFRIKDSGYLYITPTLAEFLNTVPNGRRQKDNPIDLIWIDSVCINQADVYERNDHVKIMGFIYRAATEVVVWLGGGNEDSLTVATFISSLAKTLGSLTHHTLTTLEPLVENADLHGLPVGVSPQWKSLVDFLFLPWFKRTWIQQEVILASSISVAYGCEWIQWDDLVLVARNFSHDSNLYLFIIIALCGMDLSSIVSNSENFVETIDLLCRMDDCRSAPRTHSMLENLINLHICNSTDPRDKIYSVLGISIAPDNVTFDSAEGCAVEVSYQSTSEEVFISFARRLLLDGDSNRLLAIAGHEKKLRSLPSWVPDWSYRPMYYSIDTFSGQAGYNASGTSSVCFQASPLTRIGEIMVAGRYVDELKQVNLSLSPYEQPDVNRFYTPNSTGRDGFELWITDMKGIAKNLDPYVNGQSWLEACWRTLSANRTFGGSPLPTSWDVKENHNWYKVLGDTDESHYDRDKYSQARLFSQNVGKVNIGRHFGVTQAGYMGVIPKGATPGDILCIFLGHNVPFIVRQVQSDVDEVIKRYKLIGECYVHGIMNGEIMDRDDIVTQNFLLV